MLFEKSKMERLIKLSQRKTNTVKTDFKRFLYTEIDWNPAIDHYYRSPWRRKDNPVVTAGKGAKG